MPKFQDLTGQVIGKLTILHRAPTRTHPKGVTSTYFHCRCACGEEKEVASASLRKGLIQSCGSSACRGTVLLGGSRWVYRTYRSWAKERQWEFAISEEQVAGLCQAPCHYCGRLPHRSLKTPWAAKAYPDFRWNGIDRIDSSNGYTATNVVPCCRICNLAKSDLPVEEFLAWIREAYQHNFAVANVKNP
jgi:hypothetical protein